MTTTQSKETEARQRFARRIEHGHLTRDELWAVAELVRTIGVQAESVGEYGDTYSWRLAVQEYRRLVPEGGGV